MASTGSKEMCQDDRKALGILDKTARLVDDHYEVGMLWRSEDTWLPNNKLMAEARLRPLKRKFDKNEELHSKYRSFIENHLAKGYARKLTDEEAAKRGNKTWYLPHHAVFHPQKPSKIRVVFDAAAMHDGVSLNNQLYQGPDLTNSLVGVLLRFRQERIAIVADIEAMFHQVKVTPEYSDSLRFLWWENEDLNEPPAEYQMTSHIFGATDSPSCANYCLKRTEDDNASNFSVEAINTVKKNFYVDDLLKAVPLEAEATQLANELIALLKRGGFRLTKWLSNSREVLANISEEERARPTLNLDLDRLPVQRALGVEWDVERDVFQFKVHKSDKPCTKRGILSTFSSLYDPLGFVCPVVLEAKKIMQQLWKAQLEWDEPVPEEERALWERWKSELSALSSIEVPRCYVPSTINVVEITLHLFSDASEDGYGMCSYLRFLMADGTVRCSFLIGKAKTSPLRPISIPRLELQAATLSVKMYNIITNELTYQIDEVFFWTDSQTTLQYIKNQTKRFHTYVANRVAEINEATSPNQWRHCPGKLNPADDASRGVSPQKLSTNHRWWNGPEFLCQERKNWPETNVYEVPEDDPEARIELIKIHQINTISTNSKILQRLINYHSLWLKLLRHIAWLVRFVERIKSKRQLCNKGILSLEELNHATNLVIRNVQKESFADEFDHLTKVEEVKPSSSLVRLKPILVNGILRVGGRLERATSLSYEEKHPAILPKRHHLSLLIVRHFHESSAHAGREQTLAQTRQKYWIIYGRNLVKNVIRNCFKCRRLNSRPMNQIMAPLPKVRLEPYNPPFTTAGVDFFGPLMVKQGRGTAKRWGCLITCLTTRAVYLEVVPSLLTDDFILLLRQFVSRRGPPKEIRSDRGTNFVGADREMREAMEQWDQTKIVHEMQKKEVKWVFHPPTAAHMSGIWERLVQTTKKHLKTIIGDRLLNDFALRTLFAEIEFIMNNRPLIAVSDDPADLEALTPQPFPPTEKNCWITTRNVCQRRLSKSETMEKSPIFNRPFLEEMDPRISAKFARTPKMVSN